MSRTLAELFQEYDPPDLDSPSCPSSTRPPGRSVSSFFDALPDATLHIQHESNILSDLSRLLDESWTEDAKTQPIGPAWDMFLNIGADILEHHPVRNEIIDLGGVFVHQLFGPVNYVASSSFSYLKPEAYAEHGMRSSFGSGTSLNKRQTWADHYASLRPPPNSVRLAEDRCPVEKKLPKSLTTPSMMSGLTQASTEEGLSIVKGVDDRGNEQYTAVDTVHSSFLDAVVQVSVEPGFVFYTQPPYLLPLPASHVERTKQADPPLDG